MLNTATTTEATKRNQFGEVIRPDGPCGTQNRIYRCKRCKTAKTLVMTRVRRYLGTFAERFRGIARPQYKYWLELDGVRYYAEPTCPGCNGRMGYVDVVGVKNDHECGAKCMGSRGPSCECSCGGANHGRAFCG